MSLTPEIINLIRDKLNQSKLDINFNNIRQILKDNELQSYYEQIPEILKELGPKPLILDADQYTKLKYRISQVYSNL